MMKPAAFGLLLSLFSFTQPAWADSPGPALEAKARITTFTRWDMALPLVVNTFGGSFELALHDLVTVEAGANLHANVFDQSYDYFILAGGRYTFLDRPLDQSGWRLGLSASVGYRYYASQRDGQVREETHAFHATLGLDATYWLSSDFGIELRLAPCLTAPVSWSEIKPGFPNPETSLGATLTVGFVFGAF